MFWTMGNHLEPFSKVSDPPEGQEQGGGAVGGQGRLQGVKVSLLEVVLCLLQPLHPVPDLQVGLRLMKMVPNDFSWPKTWV